MKEFHKARAVAEQVKQLNDGELTRLQVLEDAVKMTRISVKIVRYLYYYYY